MINIFTKEEEKDQIISALMSINELINNGMFQLDEETEKELINCGIIEQDVEEMQLCLESVISIIEQLPPLKSINDEGSK